MIPDIPPEPDFTVAQAATWLVVTRQTIYDQIGKGKLHAYKIGRATRITRESIEALRAARGLAS